MQGCLEVYVPGVVANILVSVERPRMWNLVMFVFPSVLSVGSNGSGIDLPLSFGIRFIRSMQCDAMTLSLRVQRKDQRSFFTI